MKKAKVIDINEPPKPKFPNRYERLGECMDILLTEFDDMDTRERIATLSAIARIEVAMIKIREDGHVAGESGTAVKRYEAAFQANAARGRKAFGRNAPAAAIEDLSDDDLEY